MFTRTYDEAEQRNRRRREQIAAWPGDIGRGEFDWVTPPVLNANTRLAVEMCPATGVLRAVGYEMAAGNELPQRVTRICELSPALSVAQVR